jgi:hypothetical protein
MAQSDTLTGDMDKMHLVLSSDNVFILVSDKITKKGGLGPSLRRKVSRNETSSMMNAFANLLHKAQRN